MKQHRAVLTMAQPICRHDVDFVRFPGIASSKSMPVMLLLLAKT